MPALGANPDSILGAPPPKMGLFHVNGTALHVEVRGNGPAVLLIPGGAEDAEGWRAVVERIPDRTVVTYDRRGTLRSGRDDWPGRGSAQHADDAAALILQLGLGDVVVFGASSAGVIALQLAIRHPTLVRRALVYEPGFLAVTEPTRDLRSRAMVATDAHLDAHPGDWTGAYRAFVDAVGSTASIAAPSGRDWYRQREELNAEPFLRDDLPFITAEAVDQAGLASTPVAVQFVHGSETGAAFRDLTARLAAIRGGLPDVIDGAGHAIYLQQDAAATYLSRADGRP